MRESNRLRRAYSENKRAESGFLRAGEVLDGPYVRSREFEAERRELEKCLEQAERRGVSRCCDMRCNTMSILRLRSVSCSGCGVI